jgi:ABC-2 type transport system permease protein
MSRLTVMQVARVLFTGLVFHLKHMSQSTVFLLTSLIQPLIFATIAFYLFRAGQHSETLLYAAIGAGFMGIWASTLFGSGAAIAIQRHQGTLELLVAAPVPLLLTLLPITLATSTVGLLALVATLGWGWLLFSVPLHFVNPEWFAMSLVTTVFGLGALGLLMASTFVLYRHASALSNMLEYPVWLASGLLVPASLLPGWARALGWLLAPTWGVQAVRDSALGGNPLPGVAACAGLGAAYVLVSGFTVRIVERLALDRGSLPLT